MATELQRSIAFRTSFARRQATSVREVDGGFVVRNDEFPLSYEHNQLHLDGTGFDPAGIVALADDALSYADHRLVTVYDDALGAACVPLLVAAGYQHGTELVMHHAGPAPAEPPAVPAGPVEVAELAAPYGARLREWMPELGEEGVRQLVERRDARLRGAEQVLFLAARTPAGEVAAWADLYLDPPTGTAQIEDLITALEHTRHGYADTVLATALHRAAGVELRFLIADGEDWPQYWYGRRGFTVIGRGHSFTRN
ncbi:GNAT family N-acetyltransferase [Kitasatospora sp. NPDC096147]|uniref:GNAT family N-acetyltransferase n=1 Tax=Kitasatospora sp. NPDC096147 TaxID=3364093 RepID=UPI0037FA516A